MGLEVWKRVAKGSSSNGMSGMQSRKSSSAGTAKKSNKSAKSVKNRSKVAKQSRKADRGIEVSIANEQRRWRAESDLDALSRANEILDSPGRVKAAQAIAREKAKVAQVAAESIGKIGKGE